MDTNELLQRVRRIEIKTRAVSNNVFSGEYHSAFKGRGMSFAEVREYQVGDDVRDIDWNVTARYDRPHVKVFEEERELTVMLLIDVSGSLAFGSKERTMKDLQTEIAATIAFSAIENNDKIGIIFYSDRIEKYIPPQKGKKHILYIIRELLGIEPKGVKTDTAAAVDCLMKVEKKRCIAFILSDFIDRHELSRKLSIASKRHDIVALRLSDKRIEELPDVGLMKVTDAESGHEEYVDTSSKKVREHYAKWWAEREKKLDDVLKRNKVDYATVLTDGDYVRSLSTLFAKRRK